MACSSGGVDRQVRPGLPPELIAAQRSSAVLDAPRRRRGSGRRRHRWCRRPRRFVVPRRDDRAEVSSDDSLPSIQPGRLPPGGSGHAAASCSTGSSGAFVGAVSRWRRSGRGFHRSRGEHPGRGIAVPPSGSAAARSGSRGLATASARAGTLEDDVLADPVVSQCVPATRRPGRARSMRSIAAAKDRPPTSGSWISPERVLEGTGRGSVRRT